MTLIILLIVLLVERFGLKGKQWQPSYYLAWYFSKITKDYLTENTSKLTLFALLAAPAIIAGLIIYYLTGPFLEFFLSLFVLAVAIGDAKSRTLYRKYLNALSREDEEAQFILQQKLQGVNSVQEAEPATEEQHEEQVEEAIEQHQSDESLGETLIWVNFKFYAVPIFYFVIFGIPGVIFYTTLLYAVESNKVKDMPKVTSYWLEALFWLPARLVSLGYMLVGHFSYGLEAWLRYAVNVSKSSREMLCKVALASENLQDEIDKNNAQKMVRLTKRNMVVFLVVVALLTLYGQIM